MGIFKEMQNAWNDVFKKPVDKNAERDLIAQLKEMEELEKKKYTEGAKAYIDSERPADKVFEYQEAYQPIDENTLREQSEKKYEDSYIADKKKENEKYDTKYENAEKKEQGYKEDAVTKSEQYKEAYDDKKDSFKSTASKNGIADSSINISKQNQLDDEKDFFVGQVMKSLQDKLDTSAQNKKNIIEQKNNKLTAIDNKFSKDVENYLKQLMSEEDKKVKEVETANKKIAQEEKDYKKYQEQKVKEAEEVVKKKYNDLKEAEKLGDYGTLDRKKDFENRLKLAMDFYGQYAPTSVYNSITNNNTLRDLLGGEYFKLLTEYQK